MPIAKLTLSAEKSLIEDAKLIAARQKTSVSAMFARFLRSLAQPEGNLSPPVGPITRQATGIVKLSRCRSDEDLVEDALSAKYRPAR